MFSSNLVSSKPMISFYNPMHLHSCEPSFILRTNNFFWFIFFVRSSKNTDSTSVPTLSQPCKHLAWPELLCVHVSLVLFGQLPAASNHLHNVSGIRKTSRVKAILYQSDSTHSVNIAPALMQRTVCLPTTQPTECRGLFKCLPLRYIEQKLNQSSLSLRSNSNILQTGS